MFRPFLPCGIAYGFAYALPMALPMAFHALFPAEGIPPGCLYCTISARCLSTGFGRISAAFAFFRRRGVPPCRGGGLLRRCRLGERWRCPTGGVPSLLPALPLAYFIAPYPPSPRSQSALPRRGRGRLKVYFAGGFAPGTPALNRLRHLQTLPEQVHGGTTRREPIPVGFAANHGFSPGDARGEAPCIRIQKISPFPGGEERSASAGRGDGGRIKAKGRGGRRQARQATPADSGTARSADDQPGKPPHHLRAAYASSREAAVWAESRRKEG